jgi:hypothetical protein
MVLPGTLLSAEPGWQNAERRSRANLGGARSTEERVPNPLRALFVAPIFRRIGFVLVSTVAVTLLEPEQA